MFWIFFEISTHYRQNNGSLDKDIIRRIYWNIAIHEWIFNYIKTLIIPIITEKTAKVPVCFLCYVAVIFYGFLPVLTFDVDQTMLMVIAVWTPFIPDV